MNEGECLDELVKERVGKKTSSHVSVQEREWELDPASVHSEQKTPNGGFSSLIQDKLFQQTANMFKCSWKN